MNNVAKLITLAILAITAMTALNAQAESPMTKPSIEGYSPVSYFTTGKAEVGSAEFAVEHKDHTYYLTSAEQVALFNENPDRYRPRHNSCAYSLAYGKVRPLDPTNFKIIDDTLLLFHRSDKVDALVAWNESTLSEEELLERADSNLFLVKF